jgi:hypothetical protein
MALKHENESERGLRQGKQPIRAILLASTPRMAATLDRRENAKKTATEPQRHKEKDEKVSR